MQQRETARQASQEGRKRAHRRFSDAVLALSRAFALAAASDEARDIRDEVGFFQTVWTALAKSAPGTDQSSAERDLAVQQIVSRAVLSTETVDILEAAGQETPDISILSDAFLDEIRGMEKKNPAHLAGREPRHEAGQDGAVDLRRPPCATLQNLKIGQTCRVRGTLSSLSRQRRSRRALPSRASSQWSAASASAWRAGGRQPSPQSACRHLLHHLKGSWQALHRDSLLLPSGCFCLWLLLHHREYPIPD